MTVKSSQGIVTRVTGGSSRLTAIDVATDASDQHYLLGAVTGTAGGEGLFCIHLYGNTVSVDYTLEEAIDEDGPWVEIETGTALAASGPDEVTYNATGVFYAGVMRLTVNGGSAGTYSVKMLAK